MSGTIILKNSTTASAVPTAAVLQVGEVAVNTADGEMFTKHSDGTIKKIGAGALALKAPIASPTFTGTTTAANLAYTGTLTGSTGILNIGSGQVYKDASGNVGIGTSSPGFLYAISHQLAIVNNQNEATNITVSNATVGAASSANLRFYGGPNSYSSIGLLDNNGSPYLITHIGQNVNYISWGKVGTGELMRIDSSGNVGIGTSSPSTQLHIASTTAKTRIDTTSSASANPELQLTAVGRQFNVGVGGATFGTTALQGSYYLYDNTAAAYRMVIDVLGNMGIGTTLPNASAILDAQSTTKGVRFPNMTTTQKNAIVTPAAGLVVFDTTLAKLCLYTGAAWQTITSI